MKNTYPDDTLVNLQAEYDKTQIQEIIDELTKRINWTTDQ